MYGFIYETINKINGKRYIGKKVYDRFGQWQWYLGSGELLKKAIIKYGRDNFTRKILCECSSKDELEQKEIEYIKLFNAVESDKYYNLAEGGTGEIRVDLERTIPLLIKDWRLVMTYKTI